jgi:hypothetical protein
MKPALSYPYVRPAPERVSTGDWLIATPLGSGLLGEELAGWDYATNLLVSVSLKLDLSAVLSDCGLGSDSKLVGLIFWRSARTGLHGSSAAKRLVDGENCITLDLMGSELGGRLDLETRVVLIEAQAGSVLSPRRAGSILWSQKRAVDLEGTADRFPVELRDFQKAGLRGPDGAWVLHWDSHNPDWSASSCVRLWMNSRHPVATILTGAKPDPRTMSVLRHDITHQLIDEALDNDELSESDWPAGSLGAVLLERVNAVFPGLSLNDCRALRRDRRDDFESAIQSATSIFKDSE